jgi:two-component system, response regulator
MNISQPDLLLVEDDEFDIALTLQALKDENLSADVKVARDGEEALQFLFYSERYGNRCLQSPKVIFLDLKLPKVDGLQVLQRCKLDVRTRSIPVVLITSSVEDQDVAKAYSFGVNSYIQKPMGFAEACNAIRTAARYWLCLNETGKIAPVTRKSAT